LVSAVNSSVTGVGGYGPGGSSARTPVAPGDGAKTDPNFVQGGISGDAGGAAQDSASGSNLAGPVSGAFAAQAYAQENGASPVAQFGPRSPKQAAAAYQSTETQTDPKGASDVQLPGMPARLASGRALDLTT